VRSIESVALDVLRSIEDRLLTDGVVPLVATTAVDVALYILNQKRAHLKDIEQRYRVPITVTADEELHVSQFVIDRSPETEMAGVESSVVHMDWAHHHPTPVPASAETAAEAEAEPGRRRSRRRRRRGRGRGAGEHEHEVPAIAARGDAETGDEETEVEGLREQPRCAAQDEASQPRKPRRRGRRGGRRRGGQRPEATAEPGAQADLSEVRASRAESAEQEAAQWPAAASEGANGDGRPESQEGQERPIFEPVVAAGEPQVVDSKTENEAPAGPPRRGWWSR
jgi:ribonuclease E